MLISKKNIKRDENIYKKRSFELHQQVSSLLLECNTEKKFRKNNN